MGHSHTHWFMHRLLFLHHRWIDVTESLKYLLSGPFKKTFANSKLVSWYPNWFQLISLRHIPKVAIIWPRCMNIMWSQSIFPNCFVKLLHWFIVLPTIYKFNFITIGLCHFKFFLMIRNSPHRGSFCFLFFSTKKPFPLIFISCLSLVCVRCLLAFLLS